MNKRFSHTLVEVHAKPELICVTTRLGMETRHQITWGNVALARESAHAILEACDKFEVEQAEALQA